MPKKLVKLTFEISVPLTHRGLDEDQVEKLSYQVKKAVKGVFLKNRVYTRAIHLRTIVDYETIAESNASTFQEK